MVNRITDDYFDIDAYDPEAKGVWLRCDRKGVCVGLLMATPKSPLNLRVHICIPKKYRPNCLIIGKAFMHFLEKKKGSFLKLSTTMPAQYGNAVEFAKRLGFTVEGIDKLSYKKDDKVYDRVVMSYIF